METLDKNIIKYACNRRRQGLRNEDLVEAVSGRFGLIDTNTIRKYLKKAGMITENHLVLVRAKGIGSTLVTVEALCGSLSYNDKVSIRNKALIACTRMIDYAGFCGKYVTYEVIIIDSAEALLQEV